MHFCTVCGNMYYIRLIGENEDTLVYYCRKCGHENDTTIASLENICVSKTEIQSSGDSYNHIINEYTKLDPTLPHLTTIKCPNNQCPTNTSPNGKEKVEPDVLYLRYDDANMKFVYICAHCEIVWKSADDK